MAQKGSRVIVHYIGTFDDGTEFGNSYVDGNPADFILGVGMMIPGFDKAVLELEVGDKTSVHLEPEEAYGEYDPALLQVISQKSIPGAKNMVVGEYIVLNDAQNHQYKALILKKEDDKIWLEGNNPLAGKTLNFELELVEATCIPQPGEPIKL